MIIKYTNIIFIYILITLIKIYQFTITPLLKNNCRYLPTCSEYSINALKEHGIINGIYYSVKRIISCNPIGGKGFDPVPKKNIKDCYHG